MSGQQYLVFCKTCDEVIEDKGHQVDLSKCDVCSQQALDGEFHTYDCGWDECGYHARIREHIDKGCDVVRVFNPY